MNKVCFVVPSFPTLSETFVTNQVLKAKEKGFNVLLLTKHLLPFSNSSQQELLTEHHILEYIHVVTYGIPKSKFKRRIIAFFLILKHFKYWFRVDDVSLRKRFSTLPFQLAFYNKFKDVSVFHIQFALAGLEIAKMKSIGLLPGNMITTFHGFDVHFQNQDQLIFLQNRYHLLLKHSKYLTVNTVYLYNKVKKLGADIHKIKTIPMGIDLEFFHSKKQNQITKNSKIYLVSIGRLIELKGFEYAIKSVKILIDKGYNILYTIIGEGLEREKLLQLIFKLKLNDNVFLVGAKSQTEIKQILKDNHIFLMSSVTDSTNRAEAQGVVTLEAQAMGLPVVAFDSGGVKYTIIKNETGFLVQEKNVVEYANGLIKLIENPSLYIKMSKAAIKHVTENFSNDVLTKEFFKLYE